MKNGFLIAAAALGLAALAVSVAARPQREPDPSVSGSVFHREKIALPPSAIIRVRLEDVSKADAKAKPIAEVSITAHGKQSPFYFTMHYPANAIHPGHRYGLRASIYVDGKLRFTSTDAVAFPDHGKGASILVRPATSAVSAPRLEGTKWTLFELNGKAAFNVPPTILTLTPDGKRIGGSGGVNSYGGSYTLQGSSLRFSNIVSTLMAGPREAMERERNFFAALNQTTQYQLVNGVLSLSNGSKVLAKLRVE